MPPGIQRYETERRSRGALATPEDVAECLRTTKSSLAQMRYRGTGPAFIRVGRRVLYRWSDVDEFLAEHRCLPTDRPASR
ncbi:helix-turn-helix domain-containing protein [Mycobacterium hackensackense]|uniref:helix-turn-helix transcriptional regulator n=1 Tax=Mycobacterium hackensackense TaxID=228909 RepID=UPI002265D0E4|nr:helix-turn-helix domain-containing protein [Mycobacterium hackensackense]MCV7251628.1 helix-turn-helix domain-containing protein [Mycobacterium hackensackense]